MKESKEDSRYRKFHSPTPRHKFRNALFILKVFYPQVKIDRVWSNRGTIYRCLWEVGCKWQISRWSFGYHGGWVLSNQYDKNLRDKWLNNEHHQS